MKKIVEITETITRTYKVEVEEKMADFLVEHDPVYGYEPQDTASLDKLLRFHEQGNVVDEDYNLDSAVLYDDDDPNPFDRLVNLYYME